MGFAVHREMEVKGYKETAKSQRCNLTGWLVGSVVALVTVLASLLPTPTLAVNDLSALSPAQLQAIQQLSPAQRKALMEQLGGSQTVEQQAPEFPEVVRQVGTSAGGEDIGPIRARGGDTLIISIQKPQALEDDERAPPLPSYIQDLLGSYVYELDTFGVLDLLGIGRIRLAGLTEPQIASRLASTPQLQGYRITVAILPLQPIGTETLQPFGYDLFEGVPTTFAPATDVPVPADYVIGPGDTINIQLYGKENALYELVVTRDGTVQIPEIGPRSVAGLTFQQLQARVEKYVSEEMIGVRASVTMGRLRSIRIFVLGDARRPGSYTVSGLSTVTNALFYSGGIEPIGSLRNIQVKRSGKLIKRLDLYDLLLRGDTSDDIRVLPGDVIFIPPVGNRAGIAGEVRRPALYELKKERTLAELVELSGGLLPTAAKGYAQLEHISAAGERTVIDVNLSRKEATSKLLADGDVLRVPSVLERTEGAVVLSGNVERPGSYQWRQGLRLADLIPRVDVLKPRSDLNYVLIKRELPPEGRVVVLSPRLTRALSYPTSDDNVELMPRDEVIVFAQDEDRADLVTPIIDELKLQARADDPERVVAIGGSVGYSGEYPLEAGMRISDLIRAGGGLSQEAYALEGELTRYEVVDGTKRESRRKAIDLAAIMKGDQSKDLILQPFDTVNVKQIADWRDRQIVEIRGEVLFPGRYVAEEGETLTDLIERAGGFTDRAYLDGAIFIREELRKKEQIQLDRMRDQMRADLAVITLQQVQEDPQKAQALGAAQGLLSQLETTEAVGRLVIDLPGIMAKKKQDPILQDGDRLLIPDNPQEVTIVGEVYFPTSHLFDPKLDRNDYIGRSGGFTQKADKKRIYVVRANGEVLAASGSAWFGGKEQQIRAGDTIVVPLNADRVRPLFLWSSVAQIVYQVALAVAAFNAVGVF